MNETRSMVKSVLGFLLAVVLIVGGIFGFNVKVEVDEDTPALEEVSDEATDNTATATSPVDGETADEANSADTNVAEPTEQQVTATEGDVKNA